MQILEAKERTLGPDHPDTLRFKDRLARELVIFEDYSAARDISAQVVESRDRTLGPDDPITIASKSYHIIVLDLLGNENQSLRDMYAQIFESLERTQGPDDPETLSAKKICALPIGTSVTTQLPGTFRLSSWRLMCVPWELTTRIR